MKSLNFCDRECLFINIVKSKNAFRIGCSCLFHILSAYENVSWLAWNIHTNISMKSFPMIIRWCSQIDFIIIEVFASGRFKQAPIIFTFTLISIYVNIILSKLHSKFIVSKAILNMNKSTRTKTITATKRIC